VDIRIKQFYVKMSLKSKGIEFDCAVRCPISRPWVYGQQRVLRGELGEMACSAATLRPRRAGRRPGW
jgi:hypothetical protein